MSMAAVLVIALGLPPSAPGQPARWRRWQTHSCSPRLGQTDGNGLSRRARPMFPSANVMKFLAHELPRLGGRGFASPLVFARPFDRVSIWHTIFGARIMPRSPFSPAMVVGNSPTIGQKPGRSASEWFCRASRHRVADGEKLA